MKSKMQTILMFCLMVMMIIILHARQNVDSKNQMNSDFAIVEDRDTLGAFEGGIAASTLNSKTGINERIHLQEIEGISSTQEYPSDPSGNKETARPNRHYRKWLERQIKVD